MKFQIRHDGQIYTVRTVVGNGLTKVAFDESPEANPPRRARNAAKRAACRRCFHARAREVNHG